MEQTAQVTELLERARRGDRRVTDELVPLIYDELRRLAEHYMRGERSGHTLQATALVNEAYVQLVGGESGPWQNRAHFFATAATIIRRILVQHARSARSLKRGGDWRRVGTDPQEIPTEDDGDDRIMAVDEALTRLAAFDELKARLVELRFFAGLTVDEAAEAMGISPRTAARDWQVARAWLSRDLAGQGIHGP